MPTHNEHRTIAAAVKQVLDLDFQCGLQLIVVDDGSTDSTSAILAQFADDRLLVYQHPINLGKGAAVLSGAALATGSHVLILDADLEYSVRISPVWWTLCCAATCKLSTGLASSG